jgi:hypothetical protein
MSVRQVDDSGTLWFLSASDSHKNREIAEAPSARLFFQASEHAGFLTLTGSATVSRDRKKIKKLWEPLLKTWFTEGEDDPRITVDPRRPQRRLLLGQQARGGDRRRQDVDWRGDRQDARRFDRGSGRALKAFVVRSGHAGADATSTP